MRYNIIGSGSQGNSIMVQDIILLDCGLSFIKIKPFFKKIKIIFISHCRSQRPYTAIYYTKNSL